MGKSGCKKKPRGLRERWSIDAAGKPSLRNRRDSHVKLYFTMLAKAKFIFMYLYTPDDWPLSRLSSTGILDLEYKT